MKLMGLLGGIVLMAGSACFKKAHVNRSGSANEHFVFKAKKNGIDWKVNSATATYNPKDSMVHIMALGDSNERLTLSFYKKPQAIGKATRFTAGSMIPTCEFCAGISQLFSLDSLKQNSFEITGPANKDRRVMGKFSVYLKKDSLYAGTFNKDASQYEGVFNVPYETVSF